MFQRPGCQVCHLPRTWLSKPDTTIFGGIENIAQGANTRHRGFFGKGDMQKEFEEASFALKPGEISQIVQTASGLHLIERLE